MRFLERIVSFTRAFTHAYALAAALGAAGVASTQAAGEVEGLPPGADAIISINLKDARSKPDFDQNYVRIREQVGPADSRKLDEFIAKTGFDPIRQIDTATVGLYFKPNAGPGEGPDVAVALKGQFAGDKIMAAFADYAAADGGTITSQTVKGTTLYAIKKNEADQSPAFVAFPKPNMTVFANTQAGIDKAVAEAKSGAATAFKPAIKALLPAVQTNAVIWGAGVIPASVRKSQAPDPGGRPGAPDSPSKKIEDFSFSLDPLNGFALKVSLGCEDTTSAARIKNQIDAVRMSIGGMMMMGGNMPPETAAKVTGILQKFQTAASERQVDISFNLTQQELDDLTKLFESMRNQAGPERGPGAGPGAGHGAGPGGGPGSAPPGF